jgi:sporulation protein YlmC with PRC-barrel domain
MSFDFPRRASRFVLLAGCLSLGLATQSVAAQSAKTTSRAEPAQKCANDLRAFDGELRKGGYWLHNSGYGYGYPLYGYMYGGRGMMLPNEPLTSGTGLHARPGYEIRTLVASANIMAQRGQQASCEALLAVTRDIYKDYAADLNKKGVVKADMSEWQSHLISSAQPVSADTTSFRSDQLIGTDVVSPGDESLGIVDDIVLSPQTGKIAYLVVRYGGFLGVDAKYVPVPWEDFKITSGATLMVLDSNKNVLDSGPQVRENQFSANGNFAEQSRKVDDYWKAHLSQ